MRERKPKPISLELRVLRTLQEVVLSGKMLAGKPAMEKELEVMKSTFEAILMPLDGAILLRYHEALRETIRQGMTAFRIPDTDALVTSVLEHIKSERRLRKST